MLKWAVKMRLGRYHPPSASIAAAPARRSNLLAAPAVARPAVRSAGPMPMTIPAILDLFQDVLNPGRSYRRHHHLFFQVRSPLIFYPWIAIALPLILRIFRFAHRSIALKQTNGSLLEKSGKNSMIL